ncbi:uncharacterized exonuclease domain-containing protein At3g15140-like isoform X2 [Macadamia integrifolia]|uniref:uncharacterized exonuclease domain-containing protein At3g15140-like isoform X2 n=1 Tax=Macadamia integrifolia TaxID=60698 RepID=UPI001C4E8630|nr:uncharacterized exonuclease domain-containing protein At3g15140-like isoform X2 [Macadamia integrifolia]
MVLASVCVFRYFSPLVSNRMPLIANSILSRAFFSLLPRRGLQVAASASSSNSTSQLDSVAPVTERWKPLCLYHTQGKCTKADDVSHLAKFNHNCFKDLQVNAADLKCLCSQHLDYVLVLDLEGKVEILEFPVIIIDAKTLDVVDFFHSVWHDTAIPFKDVLQQFETWISHHCLWERELGGTLRQAAFVTCGNWDLKTKVPQQCKVSKVKLPQYFMEWINLKDIYLNFYHRRATGMMTMMKELEIPLVGSHHLGIDDTKNISRVLQRMLVDGVVLHITARRHSSSPENVDFLFKNRIR